MIDYLLKFSSKKAAYTFALNHGFAYCEQFSEKIVLVFNGIDYSMHEIGSHMIASSLDDTQVEFKSDGKYWLTLRLSRETALPSACSKYIVWSSLQGLARPKNNPDIPNINWA